MRAARNGQKTPTSSSLLSPATMDALSELCDLIAENPSLFPSKIAWISSRCPPPSSPRLARSHISTAASINSSLSAEIASFFGGAVANGDAPDTDTAISQVLLDAVSHACPAIGPGDADRLVSCLLNQLRPHSEESLSSGSKDLSSSTQCTPSKGKEREIVEDEVSSKASVSGVSARCSVDQSSASVGRGGRSKVAAFSEESLDVLERQEIPFRGFVQVLDRAEKINAALQEQVRLLVAKQLESLSAFLKLRRRVWGDQGPPLEARINDCRPLATVGSRGGLRSLALSGELPYLSSGLSSSLHPAAAGGSGGFPLLPLSSSFFVRPSLAGDVLALATSSGTDTVSGAFTSLLSSRPGNPSPSVSVRRRLDSGVLRPAEPGRRSRQPPLEEVGQMLDGASEVCDWDGKLPLEDGEDEELLEMLRKSRDLGQRLISTSQLLSVRVDGLRRAVSELYTEGYIETIFSPWQLEACRDFRNWHHPR